MADATATGCEQVVALAALLSRACGGPAADATSLQTIALRVMSDTASPLHSHDAMKVATAIENAACVLATALCNLAEDAA